MVRLVRLETEPPPCTIRADVVRRYVEVHDAANHPAVAAAIGEHDRPLVYLRLEERAALRPTPAAYLEDVGEVIGHRQRRPELDRRREKIREGHALGELLIEQQ